MLVGNHMKKKPVTVTPGEFLSQAREKMLQGAFRRVPVVSEGRLVGIVTDRDLRQHVGYLERTKINAVMTEQPRTVTPTTTLEEAASLLLKHKIGALPVIQEGQLVGIITTSDILQAFLDVMGASEENSIRIDFVLEGEEHGFAEASQIVSKEGGEILGVGTYRGQWADRPVCYLRLQSGDAQRIAGVLRDRGFNVLGVHPAGSG